MASVLEGLHEKHKERQLRLKKAAFKAVTVGSTSTEPAIVIPAIETPPEKPKRFFSTFEAVVHEVCSYYQVRQRDVFSNRHMPSAVKCRHIIAYIMYDITQLTNPQIGRKLNRDPTSILHAIKKIQSHLDILGPEIAEIERRIQLHKEGKT